MDSNFRPVRSPGSDRFLGLSRPRSPASASASAAAVELDEDDVLWSSHHSPEIHSPPNPNPNPNPSPKFRGPPDRKFGILAALPEDEPKPIAAQSLHRKPAISSSAATSPSSAARAIPIQKPKPDPPKIRRHSAPVNVPAGPARARAKKGLGPLWEEGEMGDEFEDDDEMLPPHEIVARSSRKDSPMTTFSVLEGAGRTLKGRDLRRVRNAVWRKTGFLD